MELYQLLPDFRTESLAWVELMNGSLLHLERMPGCQIATNNLLCAVTAVKEPAKLFGLTDVVDLADEMENALTHLSNDQDLQNERLIVLLLACCDHMKMLIEQTDPDWVRSPDRDGETSEMALLSQLKEAQSLMSPA